MSDSISRLMDGEVDDTELEIVCGHLRRSDAVATWVCYHVIGDFLRGSAAPTPGFAERFAARLASEPTVLAPGRAAQPAGAGRLGGRRDDRGREPGRLGRIRDDRHVAVRDRQGARSVQRTRRAGAPARGPGGLFARAPEYSPTAPIEGIGPGFRTASAVGPDARP